MAKSAFRAALEDAINQRHSAVHPWSEAWTSGKLDRRLLGEWVKQHYHYVSHFAEWVAAVYANCPHQDVQHFLLENVTEEEGLVGMGGAAPVRHSDLLLEFGTFLFMRPPLKTEKSVNGARKQGYQKSGKPTGFVKSRRDGKFQPRRLFVPYVGVVAGLDFEDVRSSW